jgi:hypothetical protein
MLKFDASIFGGELPPPEIAVTHNAAFPTAVW